MFTRSRLPVLALLVLGSLCGCAGNEELPIGAGLHTKWSIGTYEGRYLRESTTITGIVRISVLPNNRVQAYVSDHGVNRIYVGGGDIVNDRFIAECWTTSRDHSVSVDGEFSRRSFTMVAGSIQGEFKARYEGVWVPN